MKMIYYAHSKKIYDTPREKEEMTFIAQEFPDTAIINPNTDIGERGSIKPYLKAVADCDIVVCSEFAGHVGKGVYDEVFHGLGLDKEVHVLRKAGDKYFLKKVTGLDLADAYDWKVKYGKVVTENGK
jgi:hypothetical protein